VFLTRGRGKAAGDRTPAPLVRGHSLPAAHAAVLALRGGATLAAWDIAADGSRRVSVALVAPDGSHAAPVAVPGSEGASQPQLARAGTVAAYVAFTRVGPDGEQIGAGRIGLRSER
jgi:hypothetical protein